MTCPRSLHDGQSGSRTHDPPVESNRLNQCAITSLNICMAQEYNCLNSFVELLHSQKMALFDFALAKFTAFIAKLFCQFVVNNFSCLSHQYWCMSCMNHLLITFPICLKSNPKVD